MSPLRDTPSVCNDDRNALQGQRMGRLSPAVVFQACESAKSITAVEGRPFCMGDGHNHHKRSTKQHVHLPRACRCGPPSRELMRCAKCGARLAPLVGHR